MNHPIRSLAALALAIVLAARPLSAQSLIVGIPSASTTEPGHFVLAHESQINVYDKGNEYWNSFTFATYGIGFHTELATSVYGVSNPGSGNVALGVGFKTSLPLASTSRWAPTLTVGGMVPVSFSGRGIGIWGYSHGSVRLPGLGTRLTGGISYGTSQIFGRTATAPMVGIEQSIVGKFSFFGDWFGGTHDLAAAIGSVGWQLSPHLLVIAGVKIPNNRASGRSAIILEAAYDFGRIGPAFGKRRAAH